MRPLRLWGNKKLRIALIGVAVAVLVGLVWTVWPERHKNISLRLKFVGSGDLGRKAFGLFQVQGAEQYDIIVTSYRCVHGTNASPVNPTFAFKNLQTFRIFRVENQDLVHQELQLEANVDVVEPEKKLSQLLRTLKGILQCVFMKASSNGKTAPITSVVKPLWELNSYRVISEQTLTSDLITNTQSHF